MAITGSGIYGPTLEKVFIGTSFPASGLESETATKVLMVTDSYTPAYDSHDFRDDITNEVTGTGYTAGGNVLTSTEVTLASGVWTYDTADPSWPSSTISNAMGSVIYIARGGASSADELWMLSDFVTAASSSSGTFTIQVSASGWASLDYVP